MTQRGDSPTRGTTDHGHLINADHATTKNAMGAVSGFVEHAAGAVGHYFGSRMEDQRQHERERTLTQSMTEHYSGGDLPYDTAKYVAKRAAAEERGKRHN